MHALHAGVHALHAGVHATHVGVHATHVGVHATHVGVHYISRRHYSTPLGTRGVPTHSVIVIQTNGGNSAKGTRCDAPRRRAEAPG